MQNQFGFDQLTLHINNCFGSAISVLIEGATSVDSGVIAVDGIVDNQRVAPRESIVRIEPLVLWFCGIQAREYGAGDKQS